MAIANLVILLFFPVAMAFAASSDLMTMKISNRLILVVCAMFCLAALLMAMPLREFGIHVALAIAVLVGGFTLFAFGWVGGGDAKLAAAATLWLGLAQTLPFLVYAALLGGALTLTLLALRQLPLPQALVKIVYTDTSVFAHFAG